MIKETKIIVALNYGRQGNAGNKNRGDVENNAKDKSKTMESVLNARRSSGPIWCQNKTTGRKKLKEHAMLRIATK